MLSIEPRPLLPRDPPPAAHVPSPAQPVFSIQPRPLPPPREPSTGADILKAFGVVLGVAAVGYGVFKVVDALTESPAEARRRELNRVRLGLPAGRISLPEWYRDEISRAHAWRCEYCGVRTTRASRQIDHVKPVSRGGSNEPYNLVNACEECNQMKGAMTAAAFRALLRTVV